MAHVVVDVEVGIVDPDRPAQVEWYEPDDLPVARNQGELLTDHLHDVCEIGRWSLEDRHRCDVHVADIVLEMQERGVQGAKPVNAHRYLPPPTIGFGALISEFGQSLL